MQAVTNHQYCSILETLGTADISAHVDFWALKQAALANKSNVFGTILQRDLLLSCGIEIRLQALINHNPELSEILMNQLHRLIDVGEMGSLFKAMSITSSSNIIPLGFGS